ncbi:MAG: CRISPR-associated endonuclease Cas2 [Chloroflexi bacterium]|nr:CRISPR-associated endonuclease Cas2 [Chloroflexota bacterium]
MAEAESYFITYDIKDPKRLNRVFKTLLGFARHIQLSVFFGRITRQKMIILKERIEEIIEDEEDQVIFIKLCADCSEKITAIGTPLNLKKDNTIII